jgi:hypothetical protein
VKDESLIEEMRAALNGDRERAEQRRRGSGSAEVRERPAWVDPEREARPGLLARLGLRRAKS